MQTLLVNNKPKSDILDNSDAYEPKCEINFAVDIRQSGRSITILNEHVYSIFTGISKH